MSGASGRNGVRCRLLGIGAVAISEKEDDILLGAIGEDDIEDAVTIEVAGCNTGYIASRMKDRGLKGTVTVAKDNDEAAVTRKAIAAADGRTVGTAKCDICVAVPIEVGK